LVISLDKKRKHLKDFTVALFGRTKAGKSTLRETLTRGNGSTIGKGSQRTTRDVKEYSWQGLRLLDTPGIEAYQGDDDTNKANDITALCATNWYSSSSEKNSFGVVDSSIRGLLVTTVGLLPKYFSVKTS
ncbi:MAG: GTPase, partial [Dolichospermum sp.]